MLGSRLAFLLGGLLAGLALGLLWRGEPGPAHSSRSRGADQVSARRAHVPPTASPAAEAPDPETSKPVPAPQPADISPSGPVPAEAEIESGLGLVAVDFRGSNVDDPLVRVEGRGLEGDPKTVEFEADDGVARAEFVPGRYLLRWSEGPGGIGPRALWVRVEAGRVTRVAVADPGLLRHYPNPAGLGRLDVYVAGLDGGPLVSQAVALVGREFDGNREEVVRRTDTTGRARFDVLPGHYELRVGLRREAVTVAEGTTSTLDVRYRDEGELLVAGPLPGWVGVKRVASGEYVGVRRSGRPIVYLPPGEYLVFYRGGRRLAGRARVRSGARARFDWQPPPGALTLQVDASALPGIRHASLAVFEMDSDACVYSGPLTIPDRLEVSVDWLAPGRYRVRIRSHEFLPVEEVVEVREAPVERAVRLVPKSP